VRFKPDREATAAAHFLDSKSYVSHFTHPGTNHQCIFLRGKDVEIARMEVFEREKGRCWKCGAYYGWKYGHLHHKEGGLGARRCWCESNLEWSCPRCHREHHVHVRSDRAERKSA